MRVGWTRRWRRMEVVAFGGVDEIGVAFAGGLPIEAADGAADHGVFFFLSAAAVRERMWLARRCCSFDPLDVEGEEIDGLPMSMTMLVARTA